VKLLLDTHLLIWGVVSTRTLSVATKEMLTAPENELYFSVVSIWEVAIKRALGKDPTMVDPSLLRSVLLRSRYLEVPILSSHALATMTLPPLHGDPFDRMLVAQASVEGMILLTSDARLSEYLGPVRLV